MTAIGSVRTPPFARLPDACALFGGRHRRFELLQPTSPVADYIGFLAMIAKAQQKTAQKFSAGLFEDAADNAPLAGSAPPLDRLALAALPVFQSIATDFLAQMERAPLNRPTGQALSDIKGRLPGLRALAANLVHGAVPAQQLALHVLALAALQILLALAAQRLDANRLKPQERNLCPACGGTHSGAMIAGWSEAEGARFCSCLYCGTLWHYVRIKCTFCGATGGIEYREIDGGPGSILAETCQSCGRYCKQMDHQKDMAMNVFADDIGSIGLDLLVRDSGAFSRGAFNPFMTGY